MTNAQSKFLVCEENFPAPYLSHTAKCQLVAKAEREQGLQTWRRDRKNHRGSYYYSIFYSYDTEQFVVKFTFV
jgi:hypothetical protein